MEKQHYIYRMFNEQSGEYYIGQRTCKGTAWLDGKYKGSGKVITKKVKAHPEQWKKEILCFAASREMLNELEILYIGDAWRDDPLCLNLCAGGGNFGPEFWTEEQRVAHAARQKEIQSRPEVRAAQSVRQKKVQGTPEARAAKSQRMKKFFESEENRAAYYAKLQKYSESEAARAAYARMKKYRESEENRAIRSAIAIKQHNVQLTSPEGDKVEISRNLLLHYLMKGYTFTQYQVFVQNHELRQQCHYNGKKAVALLLSDCGWIYGTNTSYTRVGVKQVEESLK